MLAHSFQDEEPTDVVVVSSGAGTQTAGIRLGLAGELAIEALRPWALLCDQEDLSDEESSCFERLPGQALATYSTWFDGSNCLALGMAGDERPGGVGFWCATGTRHRREHQFFLSLDSDTERLTTLETIKEPTERLLLGTSRGLYVYEGDGSAANATRVTWSTTGLPPATGEVAALSAHTAPVSTGALVAVAYADDNQGQVVVGEIGAIDTTANEAPFLARWCLTGTTPGFGTVTKLARLEQEGEVHLLVSASGLVPNREESVRIYALELATSEADVQCEEHPPWVTLTCADVDGADVDCQVDDSDFGTALDVGNLDDTPEYEVVVGCPGATADGFPQAGAGYIFRPARDGAEALEVLVDSGEKRDNNRLGAGLVVAPIGGRGEPVLASPGERSLLLFLCSGVGDAAPLWDSPLGNDGTWEDQRCRNPER
jgi:hypothetical protein